MNDDDKTVQAVAGDADGGASKPAPEAQNADAQDNDLSLDDILKEFDLDEDEPSKREPEKPAAPTASEPEDFATIRAKVEAMEAQARQRELNATIDRIRGNANVDPLMAKAYLNARAEEDPRIAAAYLHRERNPKKWAEVEKQLGAEVQKKFGKKVDKIATESRDAVAAAVRGSTTATRTDGDLTDRDIMTMPESDWAALQRKFGVMPV